MRMMTSAKAIWFLASGASRRRAASHLASATVTTASRRAALRHIRIDEEGLRYGRGIGEAGGLDDDRVELALALHQAFDDADEIAAHGAADAAVVHLENFLVGADDEFVVDADLAEFVDDDGVACRAARQDAVEQRGLAGAEIAGSTVTGIFSAMRVSKGLGAGARIAPNIGDPGAAANLCDFRTSQNPATRAVRTLYFASAAVNWLMLLCIMST